MKKQFRVSFFLDESWKILFQIGGWAGILAGILFRRNLGVEIALFSPIAPPSNPLDWLLMLQTNRLLGLAYLGMFDLVNVILLGLMMLSLYLALQHSQSKIPLIAIVISLLGVATYLSSNTALSLLSLSDQYLVSSSELQRSFLLSATTALLALNRFSSPGAYPGSGGYVSLFLIAVAGILFSISIIKTRLFNCWIAYTGMIASILDLIYCLVWLFTPTSVHEKLATACLPAAGFFLMIWHLLIGFQLLRLARIISKTRSLPNSRNSFDYSS